MDVGDIGGEDAGDATGEGVGDDCGETGGDEIGDFGYLPVILKSSGFVLKFSGSSEK